MSAFIRPPALRPTTTNIRRVRELAVCVQRRYPGRWFMLAEEFEELDRPDVGNLWQETKPGSASAVVHDTSKVAAAYLEAVQPAALLAILDRLEAEKRGLNDAIAQLQAELNARKASAG